MSFGRFRSLMAIAILLPLAACQSPTLIVLEDPRTYVEERTIRDARRDARIRLDIASLYVEQASSTLTNIRVEVYETAVLLTGTVPAMSDKEGAGALAASVEGVGPIHNEIQVVENASLTVAAADLTIENKIKKTLRAADGINSANMRWNSVNGIVYMIGRTLSEEEHTRTIAIVGEIAGVKQVVDRMKMVPPDR